MKNLTIKKRIERKKAKSRRAIQIFWLAKADEALKELRACDKKAQEIFDTPATEFEKYVLDEDAEKYGVDMASEIFKKDLLEDYWRDYCNQQSAVKNALCRYQQAIPKGGVVR